jgi:hypothetical protein
VESSAIRVEKLYTGDPSSSLRRLILVIAAGERCAGVTGSRVAVPAQVVLPCSRQYFNVSRAQEKSRLEFLGQDQRKHAPKRVMRRYPVLKRQQRLQPRFLRTAKFGNPPTPRTA